MDPRLHFPATERNTPYIGDVLQSFLPSNGSVLEIASGSGEHSVVFQDQFPNIQWQTSDPDPIHRKSIEAWIKYQGLANIMHLPLDIDVKKRPWPLSTRLISTLNFIVCINMLHVCPWSCSEALIKESADLLMNGKLLMLYGPFKKNGIHTSRSNALFDKSLKAQNNTWGVRDLDDVTDLAMKSGFNKKDVIQMPANNFSLILHRA